jgi:hypothetical protein
MVFCSSFCCAYNLTIIGFPPPDNDLRDWLVSENSRNSQRLHGFTYSLLTVTRIALENIVAQGKGGYPDS